MSALPVYGIAAADAPTHGRGRCASPGGSGPGIWCLTGGHGCRPRGVGCGCLCQRKARPGGADNGSSEDLSKHDALRQGRSQRSKIVPVSRAAPRWHLSDQRRPLPRVVAPKRTVSKPPTAVLRLATQPGHSRYIGPSPEADGSWPHMRAMLRPTVSVAWIARLPRARPRPRYRLALAQP